MKQLHPQTEERLKNCLARSHESILFRDARAAEDCFHELGGLVQVADGFSGEPRTPGSLASTWKACRWYHGDYPNGIQFIPVLRGMVAAFEAWMEMPKRRFESEIDNARGDRVQQCPFYRRELPLDNSLVFVVMPFTEEWSRRVWSKHLKPAIERVPREPALIAQRADDLFGEDVMTDVFESIQRATVVIADITNRNANVFYELGLAHATGKRVLLISQGKDHIPFDLLRFRHILYTDNSEGCEQLEESIIRGLAEIMRDDV